jgi:polyisoprenoid-binding protein YceI
MRHVLPRFLRPVLAVLAVLAIVAAFPLRAQAPEAVETYRIDPVHSNASFRVRHLMSKVTGRFSQVDIDLNIEANKI